MQDNACLCNNPTFVQGTFSCFQSACPNAADLKQAYDYSALLCNQAVRKAIIYMPVVLLKLDTTLPSGCEFDGHCLTEAHSNPGSYSTSRVSYRNQVRTKPISVD